MVIKFSDTAPFFILASIVLRVHSLPDKSCDRIKIYEKWYERNILWSGLGKPYNLEIHKASNTLFFSFTTPETYSDVDFQLAYYNLDNKEYQTIVGLQGGCTVAIDQANDEIFLGGSDGIFKYNMVTKIADFYKEKGTNIWTLYFSKNLFYISYPDQKLHMEVDGNFAVVREFSHMEIDHIHINKDIVYFSNKTGLYRYKKHFEAVNNLIVVRQIVNDNIGNVYVCSNLGIFLINRNGLTKILDMKTIHGLAFDKDNNFVISDEKSVMKLVESSVTCVDVEEDHW